MAYTVTLARYAVKELDRLPAQLHTRLTRKLLALEADPRPLGVQKLQGEDRYRIRVGDYRVLYLIDDDSETVTVVAVGHRREVYR